MTDIKIQGWLFRFVRFFALSIRENGVQMLKDFIE